MLFRLLKALAFRLFDASSAEVPLCTLTDDKSAPSVGSIRDLTDSLSGEPAPGEWTIEVTEAEPGPAAAD